MKKTTIYLRDDQLKVLQSMNNSSLFVRKCIDREIANTETITTEKIIMLHEAAKKLEEEIQSEKQRLRMTIAEKNNAKQDVEDTEYNLAACKILVSGDFKVVEHQKSWYAVAQVENKEPLHFSQSGSAEEARTSAIELGKKNIEQLQKRTERLRNKKKSLVNFVKALEFKILDLENQLDAVYKNINNA